MWYEPWHKFVSARRCTFSLLLQLPPPIYLPPHTRIHVLSYYRAFCTEECRRIYCTLVFCHVIYFQIQVDCNEKGWRKSLEDNVRSKCIVGQKEFHVRLPTEEEHTTHTTSQVCNVLFLKKINHFSAQDIHNITNSILLIYSNLYCPCISGTIKNPHRISERPSYKNVRLLLV